MMFAYTWCVWDNTPCCVGWFVEKLGFPLAIGYVVYRLALHQIEKTRLANLTQLDRKRQIDFADKQLVEFYAPMFGARAEIANHTAFDGHMRHAAYAVDYRRQKRDEGRKPDSTYVKELTEQQEENERFFDGLNRRHSEERLAAYCAMRTLFAQKMAYADGDTRAWYDYFYRFVEMWRVYLEEEERQFVSREVRGALGSMFDEGLLQPFYEHLRERVGYLQGQIRGELSEKNVAPVPPEVGEPKDFFARLRETAEGESVETNE